MTHITPFHFDAQTIVRAVEISGVPHFVGKDVAQALGYVDATTAIRSHCKGVQKQHPLQTSGGIQNVRVLSEPDVLRLIVNSTLPAAEKFERWVFEEVLPQIRRTGSYSAAPTPQASALADAAGFIEIAARMLNMSESGKLGMLHRYAAANTPTLLPALPVYAVDAPLVAGASATSSAVTKSATALLQEHRAGISAACFNRLAHSAGILAPVTRKTSKGGTKTFSVVTDKGLAYGKNLSSPQSPRETQPHWYAHTFGQLLDVVSIAT